MVRIRERVTREAAMTLSDHPFKIDWSTRSKLRGPGEKSMGDLVRKLRDRLAPHAMGISISYVDDRIMKKLNRDHRGINHSTDVLSFPAEPEKGAFPHLGDLVICLPVAEKMARKLGVSRRREVETLVVHGFLHLCGHDHETDQGEMMALQEALEQEFLEVEPLAMSLKRGRKAGSKVKVLKDGTRKVVTGRAAQALIRREAEKKVKAEVPESVGKRAKASTLARKPRKSESAVSVKRGPGRPRRAEAAAPAKATASRKAPRKTKAPLRTGVIG